MTPLEEAHDALVEFDARSDEDDFTIYDEPVVQRAYGHLRSLFAEITRLKGVITRNNERSKKLAGVAATLRDENVTLRKELDVALKRLGAKPTDPFASFSDFGDIFTQLGKGMLRK